MLNPKPRTLAQVTNALAQAKTVGNDMAFARLMLRHGRLYSDAAEYVLQYVEAERDPTWIKMNRVTDSAFCGDWLAAREIGR